jgi:hypothetical protein
MNLRLTFSGEADRAELRGKFADAGERSCYRRLHAKTTSDVMGDAHVPAAASLVGFYSGR